MSNPVNQNRMNLKSAPLAAGLRLLSQLFLSTLAASTSISKAWSVMLVALALPLVASAVDLYVGGILTPAAGRYVPTTAYNGYSAWVHENGGYYIYNATYTIDGKNDRYWNIGPDWTDGDTSLFYSNSPSTAASPVDVSVVWGGGVTVTSGSPEPDIGVSGNGISYTNGRTLISTNDYTNFGAAYVSGGSSTTSVRTFAISNYGASALTLEASPVRITGTNAADFAVTAAPSGTLAASGGSTSVQITFNPSAEGSRNAIVSIYSDDPDESPFTFSIQGYGVIAQNLVISGALDSAANGTYVQQGLLNDFQYWKHASASYYIYNGVYSGTSFWNMDVDTSFSSDPASLLYFVASESGSPVGVSGWKLSSNGSTDVPLLIDYLAPYSNITVSGNSVAIANDDATPTIVDHTNFGSVATPSGSRTRTFTIQNTGSAALTLNGASPYVSISGVAASDFSITTAPAATVPAGGTTTFVVTFAPSANGTRSASLSISSDDGDSATYSFAIKGDGYAPLNLVVSGITSPSAANGLYIHQGVLNDFQYWKHESGSFFIYNKVYNGSAYWYIDSDTSDDKTYFCSSGDGEKPSLVDVASWTALTVAGGYGLDGAGTPVIAVAGPEINMQGNAVSILDGDANPSTADHTGFGSVPAGSGTVVRTYTIQNTGTAALTLGTNAVSISGSSDFSVTAQPSSSVAAGGSTTFQVTFDPVATGTRSATVSVANDDSDENPYDFAVEGSGANTAPTLSGGPYVLAGTNEDTISSGTPVSSILGGLTYADADSGAASGIVVGAKSGNGTWQYSTDTFTWSGVGVVSNNSALLLSSSAYVRYVPDGLDGETATLFFRAWDQSSGTASTNSTRSTADISTNGGSTAFSTSMAQASLSVSALPDVASAPTAVTATRGNAQATVSFTAPVSNGGAAITGYTVTSNPGGFTATGASSPINVTGLTNGTSYTFTVTATNIAGTSAPSITSTAVTPATIADAPTGVVGTAGDTQVSVAFTAPASNGGAAITSYTVTSSGGQTATGSASPITVAGLTNGTAYTFTVTATNGSGTSVSSTASASVTPKAPQTINFNDLYTNLFSGAYTWPHATSTSGLAVTFTSDDTSIATVASNGRVDFVKAGTASITAHQAGNSAYLPAADVTKTFVINPVAPGAPLIGTATPGNAQASVSFYAPTNTGGSAITSYTATSSPGGLTATGSASPLTVTGLTNGTSYTFTVQATNSASLTGAASAASNAVTPTDDATPPTLTQPAFSNIGAGQVTLSLTSSETGKGYFTIIEPTETGGTANQTKAGRNATGVATRNGSLVLAAASAGTYTVQNLSAATDYTVVFTAEDATGNLQGTPQTATFTTTASTVIAPPKWKTVGNENFSADYAQSLKVVFAPDGTPYVAFVDYASEFAVTVKKFDGAAWVTVGTPSMHGQDVTLAFAPDGSPWIAFLDSDHSGRAAVMKFDGTAWVNVGGLTISSDNVFFVVLAFAPDGTPCVGYRDGFLQGNKAVVMKLDGSSWFPIGASGISAGAISSLDLAFAPDGTLFAAFSDDARDGKAVVMKFDGAVWGEIGDPAGISAGAAVGMDLAVAPDGTLYVAYVDAANDNQMAVLKYSGGTWVPVGAGSSPKNAEPMALALSPDGIPYVALAADRGGWSGPLVMKFDGAAWANVVTPHQWGSEVALAALTFAPDGKPYVGCLAVFNDYRGSVMALAEATVLTSVDLPASGYYKAGDTLEFVAHFNLPVTLTKGAGGEYAIPLGILDRDAKAASTSNSKEIHFTYTVAPGDNGVVSVSYFDMYSPASLVDADGLALTPELPALNTSGIVLDTLAPNMPGVALITPTAITGFGDAGTSVKVYDQGNYLGTATADSNDHWTLAVVLSDGSHSITATVSDAAGNSTSTSAGTVQIIDTTTPVFTSALTANGVYRQSFSFNVTATDENGLRSYPGPFEVASLPPGLSINPFNGAISGTPAAAGTFQVALNAYDLYGNNANATLTFTIGKATQTLTLNSIRDQAYDPNGTNRVDLYAYAFSGLPVSYKVEGPATLSYDSTYGEYYLTLTGTGTVTVTASQAGNDNYLPATDAAQSFTIKPFASVTLGSQQTTFTYDGQPHGATVTTNPADLVVTTEYYNIDSKTSNAPTLDGPVTEEEPSSYTIPPTAVGNYRVGARVDDGTYLGKAYGYLTILPATPTTPATTTNITTPVLSGIADPDCMVNVYDGTTLLGSTTASAAATGATTGTWTFTPTTALAQGTHSITITETFKTVTPNPEDLSAAPVKAEANAGPTLPTLPTLVSAALVITIDTTAPDVPVVTTSSGSVTVNTPVIAGTAEISAIVKLYDGTTLIGTAIADPTTGAWSIAPASALDDGTHNLTVTATDAGGNVSTVSSTFTLVVNTVPPVPVIATASGNTTAKTPIIAGTAGPSLTIDLYDGTTHLGTTTADTAGAWSIAIAAALTDGTHSLTAKATKASGVTSVASTACLLNVGTVPAITTAPADKTVTAGSAATFNVTAAGTETLSYIWQRSVDGTTYTAVANGTTASYSLASTAVANSGHYRVVVSNSFGTATSAAANLTVTPAYTAARPDGYASATTGGAGGTSVVVLTAADFRTQATSTTACVITVVGQLSIGTVNVASNKTIQGADANAALVGNLNLSNVTNIIIRGLHLTNPGTTIVSGAYTDGGDALTITGSSNVFVTHCTFFDCADHDIKIVSGSDNITVSWCEFYASAATLLHRYGIQIGAASDTLIQHVTLHHNWWTASLDQRMPFSSYGYVHQYNNYVSATGNTASTVASDHTQLLSERNTYVNVASPLTKHTVNISTFVAGLVRTIGNTYTACIGSAADAGTDTVFTPAYSYEMLPTSDVAIEVAALAGNAVGAGYADATTGTATITGPTAAVTPSTSFTLTSVPAGFTAATYQWRLSNVDIASATAATYTVASAQTTHAGTYTVAITMTSGDTVVSTPQVVTLGDDVKTVPNVKVSSSGGGAPSLWYLSILALLGVRRFLRRKNT